MLLEEWLGAGVVVDVVDEGENRFVGYEAEESFLDFVEGLKVGFGGVVGAVEGDGVE